MTFKPQKDSRLLRKGCVLISLYFLLGAASAHAEIIDQKQELSVAKRNFYDVLGKLVEELENDLEKIEIPADTQITIRHLRFSENIPTSFANHLKFLVSQVFVENSETEVETTTVAGKTPEENTWGIDVALSLQQSNLLMSVHIVDQRTASSLWSANYDSSKVHASREQRSDETDLLVRYSKRKTVFHPLLYSSFHQGDGGFVTTLLPAIRILEQYDYGRLESGLEIGGYIPTKLLTGSSDAITANTESTFNSPNIHIFFHHGWNLIRDAGALRRTRAAIYVGAGLTYFFGAALSPWARLGWEWRFSENWSSSTHLGYRFPVTANGPSSQTFRFSGVEFGISVGYSI
jgi:hypothetical protein